jgi:hypothetical protein
MFGWRLVFLTNTRWDIAIAMNLISWFMIKSTTCSFASYEIHYLPHQRHLELWPIIHTFWNWNLLILMMKAKGGDVDKQKSTCAFVFTFTPITMHKEAYLCHLIIYKVWILNPSWGNKRSNMDQIILQGTWFCQTKTYGYLLWQ